MNYDVTIQTIGWIQGRRNDGTLVISPKFQRRAVWLAKERSALLSTICSNLPFPEIYVQVLTDSATGAQQYVVVDGQQRVTSILMFIDGEVTLPTDDEWNGEAFSDLTETQRAQFWDYKVVVRTLKTPSEADIRDLFTRLNTNNVSLNDQELRNARYVGKFKNACERLADNPFFQSINLFTAREIRRMEDVEFVSELLLRVVEGVTNKKDMLEQAYLEYEEDFPEEAVHEEQFNAAIQLLRSITTEANSGLIKTKSNFYSVFGACLEFFRSTRRTFFSAPAAISAALTQLFADAKQFNPESPNPSRVVQEYYDAVSRAASDKGRRTKREQILFGLLQQNEPVMGGQVQPPLPLPLPEPAR